MIQNKKHLLPGQISQVILVAILCLIGIFMLLPFFWAFSTSLRLPRDSFSLPPSFFPTSWEWKNYLYIFESLPFPQFFMNSIVVVSGIVFVSLVFSSMAAFAFSKLHFKFKNILFLYIICGLMIPFQSIAIAQFLIIAKLRMIDTYLALIIPYLANPFGIFLLRQFMAGIPDSYYDAAVIDGCSKFRIYWNIILPMSVPVLVVTGFMQFIAQWNNFFAPLIYINSAEKFTLPMGMQMLKGFRSAGSLAHILAGVIISLIVPSIVYMIGQKHLIKGTMLSGLKS
jgi:multiple sugar transport system permease protein